MMKRFADNLREAIIFRQGTNLPNVGSIIIAVTFCTLAYILFVLFVTSPDTALEYHFDSERGAVTALSAIFLAMATSFSIASLVINSRLKDPHIWLWVVMALGFGLLALDELLQFHERFGRIIGRSVDPGPFRNWNDVIVILYGVLALPILLVFLPSILRCRMVLELFVVAFLFYVIHTFIDSTQDPRTTLSAILEESAKLFCVSFLALGTFVGFLGTFWTYETSLKPTHTTANKG